MNGNFDSRIMPTLSLRPALWRSAAFTIAYFVILLAAAVPKGMVPPRFADLTWGTLASLAVYALTRWLLRTERRAPSDVGIALSVHAVWRVLLGALLGFGVYGLTVLLVSVSVAPIRFDATGTPDVSTWMRIISGFLALSIMEELGFRGYPQHTLMPVLGYWPTLVAVALVFALSHALTGWPMETALLGVFPSALLFGAVAGRSGGLAMPVGLHAALNIAYWMVGAKESPGVWTIRVAPSEAARLSTAAPLVGAGVMILAALLVTVWPRRRDGSPAEVVAR